MNFQELQQHICKLRLIAILINQVRDGNREVQNHYLLTDDDVGGTSIAQ